MTDCSSLSLCQQTCMQLVNMTQTDMSLEKILSSSGFVSMQSFRQLSRKLVWWQSTSSMFDACRRRRHTVSFKIHKISVLFIQCPAIVKTNSHEWTIHHLRPTGQCNTRVKLVAVSYFCSCLTKGQWQDDNSEWSGHERKTLSLTVFRLFSIMCQVGSITSNIM